MARERAKIAYSRQKTPRAGTPAGAATAGAGIRLLPPGSRFARTELYPASGRSGASARRARADQRRPAGQSRREHPHAGLPVAPARATALRRRGPLGERPAAGESRGAAYARSRAEGGFLRQPARSDSGIAAAGG